MHHVLSEKQRGKETKLSDAKNGSRSSCPPARPSPSTSAPTEVSELKLASSEAPDVETFDPEPSLPPAMPGWVSSALTQPRQPAFSSSKSTAHLPGTEFKGCFRKTEEQCLFCHASKAKTVMMTEIITPALPSPAEVSVLFYMLTREVLYKFQSFQQPASFSHLTD